MDKQQPVDQALQFGRQLALDTGLSVIPFNWIRALTVDQRYPTAEYRSACGEQCARDRGDAGK
jgi:hypothetical protein